MAPRLVLASASPARLRLLRDTGFDPQVEVSGVDETAIKAERPEALVETLATAKARAVAGRRPDGSVVLGCDSLLLFGGELLGKPGSAEAARARWHAIRGGTGSLLTGHCVIDTGTGRSASGVASTVVRFGRPSDAEIDAYVASGEPLQVAGGFTLDGRSAPFIDGVEGDPSNVIGLSLPLLRTLLRDLGVEMIELWRQPQR